ncbi:MAG: hypothetical protein IPH31_05650 [Lewinellaceae bacterium]|nr:hypothetical protein [Lewinellaceae bacterium]
MPNLLKYAHGNCAGVMSFGCLAQRFLRYGLDAYCQLRSFSDAESEEYFSPEEYA